MIIIYIDDRGVQQSRERLGNCLIFRLLTTGEKKLSTDEKNVNRKQYKRTMSLKP